MKYCYQPFINYSYSGGDCFLSSQGSLYLSKEGAQKELNELLAQLKNNNARINNSRILERKLNP